MVNLFHTHALATNKHSNMKNMAKKLMWNKTGKGKPFLITLCNTRLSTWYYKVNKVIHNSTS